MTKLDMESTGQQAPSHLDISIGGYGGTCYRVTWEGSALRYYVSEWHPPDRLEAVIEPTQEGWERFWAAMDEVGLWTWKASYHAPGVMDGTQWDVEMKRGRRHVKTSGSNRYPGYREEGVEDGMPTQRFERFTKAVSALIGGRPFD